MCITSLRSAAKNVRPLILLLALCLLVGCTAHSPQDELQSEPADSSSEAASSVEEKDAEGFVSLNPSITELLSDMGLTDQLVGIGDYCMQTGDLPRCGSELSPDVETIIATGAQAVLTCSPMPSQWCDALKEENILCHVVEKPGSIEEMSDYYMRLAQTVLGEEEGALAAQPFCRELEETLAQVKEAAAALDSRPQGAFAALLPLTLATGDTMQGEALRICGIDNVAEEYTDWQYPQELLLPLDPQVLVIDTRTLTADEVRAHVNYATTACVTQNRLLEMDGSALENGGRRMMEALRLLVRFAGGENIGEENI